MSRAIRATIFGLPLDLVTRSEAVDFIMESVEAGVNITQMSLNAPKILSARQDPELRTAIERSDLVTADGSWVSFAARVCGIRVPERFGGIDLFEALLQAASANGRRVFLFGATDDVVGRVAAKARETYVDLRIAGVRSGFFDDRESRSISQMIHQSGADMLFLGFPSPRKEKWLNDHFKDTGALFAMGVGGSFDVFAGDVARAPRFVRTAGLEWLWRLGLEPKRLWRRYLRAAPRFAWVTFVEMARLRTQRSSPLSGERRSR